MPGRSCQPVLQFGQLLARLGDISERVTAGFMPPLTVRRGVTRARRIRQALVISRNPPMSVPETRAAATPPPPNRGAASRGGSGVLSVPVDRMVKPGDPCPGFIAEPGRWCSRATSGKTSSGSTSSHHSPAQSASTPTSGNAQLRLRLCVGRSLPRSSWVRTPCDFPITMGDRILKRSNERYWHVPSAQPWVGD